MTEVSSDGAHLLQVLAEVPVVAVLRHCPIQHVQRVAETTLEQGVRVIEVTLDGKDALHQIELLADALPEAILGAGTVRRVEQVGAAVSAGAQYLLSPATHAGVLGEAERLDVPFVPGASTATEIERAMDLGALAVKVFPAEQLGGPAYLGALRAPLHGIPLLPSGGVDATNAADYMEAGAIGLIVGGQIFSRQSMTRGDDRAISEALRGLLEVLA